MLRYLIILLLLPALLQAQKSKLAGDNVHRRLHIVIAGESNSGGTGRDTELPADELLPRSTAYIWDNINNDGFERLDIGTNNLLGHDGIAQTNRWHGIEAHVTRAYEQGELNIAGPILFTKTGQGGSQVQSWDVGTDYWNAFLQRTSGSLDSDGDCIRVCFITLGINNAMALATGTGAYSATDYATRLSAMITRIHTILGPNSHIYVTSFDNPTMLSKTDNIIPINAAVETVCNSLSYATRINTSTATDVSTLDLVHWTSTGLSQLTQVFLAQLKQDYDL